MSDILIRQAEPEDGPALVAAIAAIDAETEFLGRPGEYGEWPEKASERLKTWREKDSGGYVLAIADGEIVGFLSIFRGGLKRVAGAGTFPHVGLRAAHRGQGIGGKLFEAAEAWARSHDMHRLELRVDEENARGRALYRRMGFEVEGTIPRAVDWDGSWRTHLVMAKRFRDFPPFVAESEPPLPPRGSLDGIEIRTERPEDAAMIRAWETQLLAERPWAFKQVDEVSSEQEIREGIERNAGKARRLVLLALAGEGPEARVLAILGAGFAEHRMRGECHVGVDVLLGNRGRGIGGELYARAERWARENGARRLTTFPATLNRRGIHFAEGRGFRPEVLAPAAAVIDGKGVDRLRMGKLID